MTDLKRPRLTAADFDPEVLRLFDTYVHGGIDRRGMFADSDDRINGTWPPYEAALKAAGKSFQAFKYPGTQHGFNNDTTPRYDANAATQAWQRTIAFFNLQLRG